MGHFHDVTARAAAFVLTSSLLVAGCSSSSDSPALSGDDNAVSETDSIEAPSQPEADPISSELSDEVIVGANDPVEETSELVAPASENIPAETIAIEQNSEPTPEAVPDPLVQNRTQVDFGITVPAYQSDALQVRLIWGNTDVTAGWVGDELWSTSLDLPTDTEHTLTVTFFDNNGDIELASFEQSYRTGSNAAEIYNITAAQFNSEQWDADNDGTNNLDELIAGRNPTIDEDSLLEVRDYLSLGELATAGVSGTIRGLPDDRPFTTSFESKTAIQTIGRGSTNIDENGNGTKTSSFFLNADQSSSTSTRTVSGSSVSWVIDRWETDGDVSQTVDGTNTVTVLDGNNSTFIEHIVRRRGGTTSQTWETNSNLMGEAIEGTSFCKPIAGTVSNTHSFSPSGFARVTTVSKEAEFAYWRVVVTSSDSIEDEYFVRDLKISKLDTSNAGVAQELEYFKCDFVDF